MSDFSYRLKQLRIKHGYTQKELADGLNVSQNAIYNWENGKREPSIDMIIKIAKYFNTSSANLIDDNGESKSNVERSEDFSIKKRYPLEASKDLEQLTTMVAHFDGDEYTEEELNKIKEFAEFVKSQRK